MDGDGQGLHLFILFIIILIIIIIFIKVLLITIYHINCCYYCFMLLINFTTYIYIANFKRNKDTGVIGLIENV